MVSMFTEPDVNTETILHFFIYAHYTTWDRIQHECTIMENVHTKCNDYC